MANTQNLNLDFKKLLKIDQNYYLHLDNVKMDPQAFQKNPKVHFLRDIEKSLQEVNTQIGPEPHQFFSFLEYLNK